MEVLRTPEDRFAGLAGYGFAPNYRTVATPGGAPVRVHFLDEGPRDGEIALLMHGEPSWSFLYRHVIPLLVGAGLRCIAPDLVGFGRSDKPARREDYTYERHVAWMGGLLFGELDLDRITLVCQDWGGLVGLRLVASHPERFSRVVAANTGLPTGDQPMSEGFVRWQRFSQEVPSLPVGRIVAGGCTSALSPEVVAGYEAPFPDESYKEGARQFPALVPTRPDDPASNANRAAWRVLEAFDRPFLCAFSDSDPITGGGDRVFLDKVPGTRGLEHPTVAGAGHFLQEDRPQQLAEIVTRFVAATP
ncbi:MAG TPA: haloalkane dehalogenase [Acidimicrobiales bacterium]|nr:haloalkane dehalogenase [Acidimicrobiales bacterium]